MEWNELHIEKTIALGNCFHQQTKLYSPFLFAINYALDLTDSVADAIQILFSLRLSVPVAACDWECFNLAFMVFLYLISFNMMITRTLNNKLLFYHRMYMSSSLFGQKKSTIPSAVVRASEIRRKIIQLASRHFTLFNGAQSRDRLPHGCGTLASSNAVKHHESRVYCALYTYLSIKPFLLLSRYNFPYIHFFLHFLPFVRYFRSRN